ncbi:MAG: hypothetical protein K2N14_03260 [Clostridia bacterium]|nr:hypothetical protein [Clostridia bacterium]
MKIRKERVRSGLSTRSVTLKLIGGEGKFCAERFAFRQNEDGLVSIYSATKAVPSASITNPGFVKAVPVFGYTLMITKLGQIFKWSTTEFPTLKAVSVLTNIRPFIIPLSYAEQSLFALYSGNKLGILTENQYSYLTIPHKLCCGAFHCGRVFAKDYNDPYVVRWSGRDFKDWSSEIDRGGYVRLSPEGGQVLDIVVLGEKIVLVREHGLTVFRAYGDARHVRVEKLDHDELPRVFERSAIVCAGKLWFCSVEGIYSYDGNTVTLVKDDFDDVGGKVYEYATASVLDDRYVYFSCTKDGNKLIMEYDTKSNVLTPFASGCSLVYAEGRQPFCFMGNSVSKLNFGGVDEQRIWISKKIDLDTASVKTLKSIKAVGEGDIEITVDCDGRKRSTGLGCTRIAERGTGFTFTVKGSGNLKELSAEWEVNA